MNLHESPFAYADVSRSAFYFGQRFIPGGSTAAPYVAGKLGDLFGTGERIYGLAIADRSEVRAVRLYVRQGGGGMPGAGVTFSRTSRGMAPAGSMELVEGAPLFGFELDPESQVALDRLDRHDGRLVLVAALTPEAAYALPRTIAPVSRVVVEAFDTTAKMTVAIAPPRGAGSVDRNIIGKVINAGVSSASLILTSYVVGGDGEVLETGSVLSTTVCATGVTAIAAVSLGGLSHVTAVINATATSGPCTLELEVL